MAGRSRDTDADQGERALPEIERPVEMIGETFSRPDDDVNGKWLSLSDISDILAQHYPSFDPDTPFQKIGNALNDVQFNFRSKRTMKHMEYWLLEK